MRGHKLSIMSFLCIDVESSMMHLKIEKSFEDQLLEHYLVNQKQSPVDLLKCNFITKVTNWAGDVQADNTQE